MPETDYSDLMGLDVELSLKVAELVDLIEIGSIAEHESGWEWPILTELRAHFTRLMGELSEAADQV